LTVFKINQHVVKETEFRMMEDHLQKVYYGEYIQFDPIDVKFMTI